MVLMTPQLEKKILERCTYHRQPSVRSRSVLSEWGSVLSGVLQGTKLGHWLFVLMINDLDISSPHLWKFVDDTTALEFVPKGGASNAQCIADRVIQWSHDNRVHLNAENLLCQITN